MADQGCKYILMLYEVLFRRVSTDLYRTTVLLYSTCLTTEWIGGALVVKFSFQIENLYFLSWKSLHGMIETEDNDVKRLVVIISVSSQAVGCILQLHVCCLSFIRILYNEGLQLSDGF